MPFLSHAGCIGWTALVQTKGENVTYYQWETWNWKISHNGSILAVVLAPLGLS